MLLSVSMRAIVAFWLIAVFSIAASAKTSVYKIPGEASAVVTTSPDSLTFQLTDIFTNPMELIDDLSAFFSGFGTEGQEPNPLRRPLLQIRMEGLLRVEAGSHPAVYCRFFPPRPIDEMSGGLHAAPGRPLFDVRYDDVNAKPSPFKGDSHIALLDRTATWTVAEMGGASFHRTGSIRFELGTTDRRDPAAAPFPGGSEPSVRGTLGIAIVIVLLGLMIRRKRQRLAAPVIVRSPAY
jgi:hypothetical protein